MKKYFITFGGGEQNFYDAVKRLCAQAEKFELFDEIIGLSDDDLKKDKNFWEKHSHFVLNNQKEYGYSIWRPYLLHKIMTEKMNYGDIIIFLDAGCELNIAGKKRFLEYIEIVKKHTSLSFQMDCLEKSCTKMDLIKYLGAEKYIDCNQIQGGIQFYLKNDENIKLLKEAYEICTINNYHYIDDTQSIEKNDPSFIKHRHEQSIMSLLLKKLMRISILNETYFYPDWNKGKLFPILTPKNKGGKSIITWEINNKCDKKGILLFHQGYTDIINCMPLINYYSNLYSELSVIVRDDMRDFTNFYIKDMKNVKGIYEPKNNSILENITEIRKKYNIDIYTDNLCIGEHDVNRNDSYNSRFYFDTNHKNKNFVEKFYVCYDIDYKTRTDKFEFNRNYDTENSFYHTINNNNDEYVLIHEDTERNLFVNKNNIINKNIKIINLNKLSNLYFDSIKLIENAKEIHCIDSCWCVFIYLLDAKYKLLTNKNIPVFANCIRGYTFMFNNPKLNNWVIT